MRLTPAALLLASLGGAPLLAHHSLSAYATERSVTVDGVVAEFQFVNPHPILVVETRTGGRAEQWRIELDNRHELTSAGVDERTLRAGERVVVALNPGRTETRIGYLQRLERPADGLRLEQVNSRPRLSRGR